MKKIALPDDEKIISGKEKIKVLLEDAENESTILVYKKLDLLKEEISRMLTIKMSIIKINQIIQKHTEINISDYFLRNYCHDIFGYNKQQRKYLHLQQTDTNNNAMHVEDKPEDPQESGYDSNIDRKNMTLE